MASDTFAGRVREAANQLRKFRARDLADAMEVRTHKERRYVKSCMWQFCKRREMIRISNGLYKYVPVKKARTKRDIIWHLVRSLRHFGLDEMEGLK